MSAARAMHDMPLHGASLSRYLSYTGTPRGARIGPAVAAIATVRPPPLASNASP